MNRTFNTREFELSHGSKPRGRGNYAFVPANYIWPDNTMPHDAIAWEWGTYTEAKRSLIQRFPTITEWVVLP